VSGVIVIYSSSVLFETKKIAPLPSFAYIHLAVYLRKSRGISDIPLKRQFYQNGLAYYCSMLVSSKKHFSSSNEVVKGDFKAHLQKLLHPRLSISRDLNFMLSLCMF
jgi:hypothetical protein